MTGKRTRPIKKIKNLKARDLGARQAKDARGGIIAVLSPTKSAVSVESSGLLLPAVQKIRE